VGIAQIKGTYHGRIEILEPVPPERYKLKIDGKGTGGFLKGEGTLALAESGAGTVVNYSGDVQVGGLIASVGQRLLLLAAKQIVNQFFEAFSKQLTTVPPGPAAAGPSSQS
jgi:carbon monoxide dehydrogenase subunit G